MSETRGNNSFTKPQWSDLEKFPRDLHSEHCRKSNSSRLEEGNPVNESTILERDGRDDATNTRDRGATT